MKRIEKFKEQLPVYLRRLRTLTIKESLQVIRDPSTLLIAILFPIVLMTIYGAGINLDSTEVTLGIAVKDTGSLAQSLAESISSTPTFKVKLSHDTRELGDDMRAGSIRGFVVIRSDFSKRFLANDFSQPSVLVVTDGSLPNTASFVAAYVQGAYSVWAREEMRSLGRKPLTSLQLETRSWFNPSTKSRNFLLPGSVTIIMTVVGALLTSLVIAREWERGTMESLLAAGVTRFELIAFKFIPYFVLGLVSFTICTFMTVEVFSVPLEAPLWSLYLFGALFLASALGLGLLLSTLLRNQYNAAQAALNAAFLPALMLSGYVFEISSMPKPIQLVTNIVPARYFVTAMQTLFQAGNVWPVLLKSMLGLGLAGAAFLELTFRKTKRSLE
jgi:ABC-2 type transport system permease protein